MSTEVVKVIDASEIESKNVEVGEWGLEFKGQLTPDEWYEVALSIQKFDGKLQWYLGDLAAYGESEVVGWTKVKGSGEKNKYEELVEATGYDYATLSNFANVARRFTNGFRERVFGYVTNFSLSFNHFRAVAPLKEDAFAEYWLKRSADNGWGVARLREELRREYGKESIKEEKPVGYITFKEEHDKFFKNYLPNLSQEAYDETTWLLEIHDVTRERLSELGIEV